MQNMTQWWGRIGLQLRLQILIQGFLIFILVAAQWWITVQFEHQILTAAKERAVTVADGAINGLNTLMITKSGKSEVISDKKSRALFIEKMAAGDNIKEMRVIRGKGIDFEFGEGLPQERPVDAMDNSVLASGKTESQLIRKGDEAWLRTVVPFIAKENFRTIKCLECHGVDDGDTVGAASVILDVRADLATIQTINLWIWIGQIVLQILLFFVVGTIVSRLLKQLGGEPSDVIDIVKQIAKGNLSDEIVTKANDDGSLLAAMREMQYDLRGVVSDIQTIVDAAAKGDFTRQADLAGKQGFGLAIGQSLNTLNANLQHQIGGNPTEAVRVAARIAAGDLSVAVHVQDGDTQSILAAMASMQGNLQQVIAEMNDMVNAAAAGDFATKMDTVHKAGYSKTLSELLNRLSDVTETGLRDVMRVAQAISEGDLTHTIDHDYPGLFGQLKDAINATVARLQDAIGHIREATQTISTAAQEIAAGNQDLSDRTQEEANSLEETSASIEELNTTVRQNADNADAAKELTKQSNAVATKGGDIVKRLVVTMSDIQQSSGKIGDIIGVIDSIAFQTNILALNAAVEAARAGEQGRGFAVVATEVRNLAQRSATAAKEIKGLIGASVQNVDEGANLVNEAGSTMEEIVDSFQKVTDLVTEIANASREQSSGIAQVTETMNQMDDATQKNAALVEEAAASAESLEEQAKSLVQAVAMFKLATAQVGAVQAAVPSQLQRVAGAQGARMSPAAPHVAPPQRKLALVAPAAGPDGEWEEF